MTDHLDEYWLISALGDQGEDGRADAEVDEEKKREKTEMQKIVEEEKKERSVAGENDKEMDNMTQRAAQDNH